MSDSRANRAPKITTPQVAKSYNTLKVKNPPNTRLFVDPKVGIRTQRLNEQRAIEEQQEKERLEREAEHEPNIFTILKERRQEEENCLDFLDANRKILRQLNADMIDDRLNHDYQHYLYKYIRYPSSQEADLKTGLKDAYSYKEKFSNNRAVRNDQYIQQRKKDFAISNNRVKLLTQKLLEEYNNNVNNALSLCKSTYDESEKLSSQYIEEISRNVTNNLVTSSLALQKVSDAVNFIPFFYSDVLSHFQSNDLVFDINNPRIPEFQANIYRTPLNNDTAKTFTTILESFQPELMTPKLLARQSRAVCVLAKPLVFTRAQSESIAKSLGWKPFFVEDFTNTVEEIFTLLSTTLDDVMIFGFPRTPAEAQELYKLFNPKTDDEPQCRLLPRPESTEIQPFDKVVELDADDNLIVGDAFAGFLDPETGEKYDVRTLNIQDENQITRLQPVEDPLLDIPQFPTRSITMKTNFNLIAQQFANAYESVKIETRNVTDDLIAKLKSITDMIQPPPTPEYPAGVIIQTLAQQLEPISQEIKEHFLNQWKVAEDRYEESIQRIFTLVNQTHLSMVNHLTKARQEMLQFLQRPGNSQHLVIEFQQWHCTQVERGMRRMQKVKDECTLRLNTLRDNLLAIENDRKAEEEVQQKDLLNAPFRTTLFEVISNCYTMLAQAEIDRWTAAHSIIMDLNQIIVNGDLVAPLPRKKLPMIADSRSDKKKAAKKAQRTTPLSKSRLENKLPPFELPLTENVDVVKKFISETSCIYIPSTAPLSTRAKKPVKDKNPLAPHRIQATDEVQQCLKDDDAYVLNVLDKICRIAQDEVQTIQNAFDAFVEDSSNWINTHYERKKAIADTAVAFMLQKVADEQQLNQLILLSEDQCTVDFTQLLAANEESPKIPPPFPEDVLKEASEGRAENLYEKISLFDTESMAQS